MTTAYSCKHQSRYNPSSDCMIIKTTVLNLRVKYLSKIFLWPKCGGTSLAILQHNQYTKAHPLKNCALGT